MAGEQVTISFLLTVSTYFVQSGQAESVLEQLEWEVVGPVIVV